MSVAVRALDIDTVQLVRELICWVSDTFPPVITDLYVGVNVYHRCPSPPRENVGLKKYG